jgi:hypothetical protein
MHGYMDRGHGHGTHAVCTEDGKPLEMTLENVEEVVRRSNHHEELAERNRMLSDIALSAVGLKLNLEHGLPPTLDALNRDLDAFDARFKSALDVAIPQGPNELERLRKENDTMRKLIAESDLNCMYCGLAKADMAKCELGFPGCGRADDLMT